MSWHFSRALKRSAFMCMARSALASFAPECFDRATSRPSRRAARIDVVGRFKRSRQCAPASFVAWSSFRLGQRTKHAAAHVALRFASGVVIPTQWLRCAENLQCFAARQSLGAYAERTIRHRFFLATRLNNCTPTLKRISPKECRGLIMGRGWGNGA